MAKTAIVDGEPIYAEYTTLCASDFVEGGPAVLAGLYVCSSRVHPSSPSN